ncbi:hypothetical protein ACJRO7_029984 [Eucalyptus globulus]|uniref:U-box domain-containing protein n=1 Tax=Eucalyptus globulus TaxID=34317 RepID=A0ABD3JCR5_EUCGL
MEGRDVKIPRYFLCLISLQIMRDPVSTVTGITYERESIEKWLSKSSSNGAARRRPDLDPEVVLREGCFLKLVKELVAEHSIVKAMKELEELAEENERNRTCMVGH